ncbi:uncharacterized protein FIBRA_00149 [Fibroporia radiculosa]|uniref:Exonuclease V n=1 Tax=Fibroporia radiculosa TaxID=599839 RepID=J7RV20_9APHY|nr:uncharacterized protein FIBRA_00149 [Fibroporia radiculosa]CCL98155.1 predicted protein [Fibroporia radiculosa]
MSVPDLDDEYAAFYTPLDLEDILLSEGHDRHGSRGAQPQMHEEDSAYESASPQTILSTVAEYDEFDVYDLSEFTAEDFACIDAALASAQPSLVSIFGNCNRNDSISDGTGGPRIEIQVEGATDNSILPKALSRHQEWSSDGRSPFERFRKWRKVLSVTDLVGPAWCEVQFDYGLRQKRHQEPDQRPQSFVTAEGKTITVDKRVMANNHRFVTRGRSVHKALEREVKPEEVQVEIITQEERWALRLVNMLASLDALIALGYCREIPVFGLVHGQIVVGIIDELQRKPYLSSLRQPLKTDSNADVRRYSPQKRASPGTPSMRKSKRGRRRPSPSQSKLSAYFDTSSQTSESCASDSCPDSESRIELSTPKPITPTQHPCGISDKADAIQHAAAAYTLHLFDTKTRNSPSLPPDEDTLTSRLQLMLYHRLLSNLLASHSPSRSGPEVEHAMPTSPVEPLDFDALWRRMSLDPTRTFSASFMRDSGLLLGAEAFGSTLSNTSSDFTSGEGNNHGSGQFPQCLNDLVAAWRHAVEALSVNGMDPTLTLVYRTVRSRQGKPKSKDGNQSAAGHSPLDQDLANAIQESLNAPPHMYDGTDDAFARASLEDVHHPIDANDGDITVCNTSIASEHDTSSTGLEETGTPNDVAKMDLVMPASTSDVADDTNGEIPANEVVKTRILGTKKFVVDDVLLDGHLESILQWWNGRRPPRGVDIQLTRRCSSCEYEQGCEWRERKAVEVLQERAVDAGF